MEKNRGTAGDYRCSNGEQLLNGRRRSAHPRPSMFFSLRVSVLQWCHVVGLRLVLLELRNLCFRIRQGRPYRTMGLVFEEVRLRVPPLCDCDSPRESNSYIAGIRTIRAARPWLTLVDYELFLQGWFQAERCLARTLGTAQHTKPQTLEPPQSNSATLQT
jgi:hypothetical protein